MVTTLKSMEASYGAAIGMITFKPIYPALIRGHTSNALTYKFPILFKMVDLSTLDSVITPEPNYSSLPIYIQAAKELEEEGVKAITTNCGYLVFYQEKLSEVVGIPVFTSSLLQVPLVQRSLRKGKKVGIICADARCLTKKHLECAGIDESIHVVITGMETSKQFWAAIREPQDPVNWKFSGDFKKVEKEVVDVAERLARENPDVGAIVCECTELSLYSFAIQEATNLPVFDMVTLVNYIYNAIVRKPTFN
jgi:aspartate/glutamate racemase